MMDARRLLVLAAIALLAACQSGNNASCSLDGGTQLPAMTPPCGDFACAAWPKFRADAANTGRAAVDLTGSTGNPTLQFVFDQKHCSVTTTQTCSTAADCRSGETCVRIGPVSTTPILGPESIFLASSDGTVYVVNYQGQQVMLTDQIQVESAIIGSPLLGADGTLFVPSNAQLTQFRTTGTNSGEQRNTAVLSGFVAASPNIWTDGTVFVGTQSGSFTGVCPNGVPRFGPVASPPTQSTAAVVEDPNFPEQDTPIIVIGGLNGQVQGYSIRGRQYWSFLASANVVAAVLIDQTTNLFYVADTAGHVYAGTLVVNPPPTPPPPGQLDPNFMTFTAAASITASPALGRDTPDGPGTTLYVADQGGVLYALDRATGAELWRFQADGPISSSPAVATGGTKDVIVFAADILGIADPTAGPVAIGGTVYAVQDDGNQGTELWRFDIGHSIGASSPSIGADGTVYIGRGGSRLGAPSECPNVDKNQDGEPDDCVVNDGGALYAITP